MEKGQGWMEVADLPTSREAQHVYCHYFAEREIDRSTARYHRNNTNADDYLNMGDREVMAVLDFFSSTGVMLKAEVMTLRLGPPTVPIKRTLGEVLSGVAAAGAGCSLIISTYHMRYRFMKDEDDWFWVTAVADIFALHDGYRSEAKYRADQLPGLRSLLTHLLRTGADHVPAGMLDLRVGDRVGTHSFEAGVVLSVDSGRYRVRPDTPLTTATKRTKYGDVIPGKVIHEPMYRMDNPTRLLPRGR